MGRMEPIRLGFVGAGRMGQCAHLRHYAVNAGCRVVALAEPRAELAAQVAKRYGVPAVYADAQQMLAGETLDAVVAIQDFANHARLLPQLYRCKLPILTEKPLAATLDEGRQLVEQLRSSGARHVLGYHKRSDPGVQAAVRQIRQWQAGGEVGAMRAVRLSMPPGDWIAGGFAGCIETTEAPPPGPPVDWQSRFYTLTNYYVHQINLMRHLLGEDYRVSYADHTGRLMVGHSDRDVTCTLEMAYYTCDGDWQEQALVSFERGWVRLDIPAPLTVNRAARLCVYTAQHKQQPGSLVYPELPSQGAMQEQAQQFLRAVRGEEHCLADAADAVKDLAIVQDLIAAIDRSSAARANV